MAPSLLTTLGTAALLVAAGSGPMAHAAEPASRSPAIPGPVKAVGYRAPHGCKVPMGPSALRTLTCEGGVSMWRDDVKLTCDRMVATFDAKGNIVQATCSGAVQIVAVNGTTARGELAKYDGVKNQVELTGKPKAISQSRGNIMQAGRIRMDLGTNELFVEDGVTGTVVPEPGQGKAP